MTSPCEKQTASVTDRRPGDTPSAKPSSVGSSSEEPNYMNTLISDFKSTEL